MMLAAARAVTSKLTSEELSRTSILPATHRLRYATSGLLAVANYAKKKVLEIIMSRQKPVALS